MAVEPRHDILSAMKIQRWNGMHPHVIGLFNEPEDATKAIEALIEAGVERSEISVIATGEKASHFELVESFKLLEGVAAGGTIGGAVGFGATLIATGAVSGGLLAVGPLLMALAGLGLGASAGGIIGALVGVGLPKHEARFYENEVVERGAALVGVSTVGRDDGQVASILHRHSARNVTKPA